MNGRNFWGVSTLNHDMHRLIEDHMLSMVKDSAHDKEHIYRVLYIALDIAKTQEATNLDVLIAACLLHDVARGLQAENPALCHAKAGSVMAYDFLLSIGWDEQQAAHVRDCILTHRYRDDHPPVSLEAKILFDADKIDAAGALGIARTLIYQGQVMEPMYTVDDSGKVMDGAQNEPPSFFHEYRFKLEKVYSALYTVRAKEIAQKRQAAAAAFYNSLLAEVRECYEQGSHMLADALKG